jgi:DNA-binding CsgD family transcriptional regulator
VDQDALAQMRGLLEGLVPDELLAAYLALYRAGGCCKEEQATVVGPPGLVEKLLAHGMAHHSVEDRGRLLATGPEAALEGALGEIQLRSINDHKRLLTGIERLNTCRKVPTEAAEGGGQMVESIYDRERIHELSHTLMNTARHEFMSLENTVVDTPTTEDCACTPPEAFKGTVRCRAIYDSACLKNPVTAEIVEASVRAGEQARVLPKIVTKFKMADDAVALVPLTPSGMGGAMLIRASAPLAMYREYFELLWERATPIGEPVDRAGGLTPSQREVLKLFAEGLERQEIAKRLNCHINTVDRHMAAIMEQLGVQSRFAAGAAAVRRRWIE